MRMWCQRPDQSKLNSDPFPQNIHKDLEKKLAQFHEREDCILYASCFDANAGLFEVWPIFFLTPDLFSVSIACWLTASLWILLFPPLYSILSVFVLLASSRQGSVLKCGFFSGAVRTWWCGALRWAQSCVHHRWHQTVPSQENALQTHGSEWLGGTTERGPGICSTSPHHLRM